MGIITDILEDLPLSTVLREKLQDMEKRYLELEKENAELKKENAEIKEEIRILKDKKSQYEIEPQFKNGLYYFDDNILFVQLAGITIIKRSGCVKCQKCFVTLASTLAPCVMLRTSRL